MNQDMVWQLVRYLLLILGGWMTNKGWVDADTVTTAIGAIGTLFIAAWGTYVKWSTTSVPDNVASQPTVPTVSPVTGKVQ